MDNDNTQPSNVQEEEEPSTQGIRGKTDPAWDHCSEHRDAKGKRVLKCLYCSKTIKGGGINRMKYNLAGMSVQVVPCKSVGFDVREQMKKYLNESTQKLKEAKLSKRKFGDYDDDEDVIEVDKVQEEVEAQHAKGKQKAGIGEYFAPRTTSGSQLGIKSVLSGKVAKEKAHMAICKWMYDVCIPFNAVNSPYFQPALDAVASIGPGYKGPTYNDSRVNFLNDCKKECALLIDSYRRKWKTIGCTIMADGWTDRRQRTLINFLVYCSQGTCFVKSVDASDVVKDAKTLCQMFVDVIEWVGPSNVVQVVTDNAANYVAAGALVHEKYDNIYWSPCAAHCVNLILKDISSLGYATSLVSRASKITVFVYNHIAFLSWLRKREGWKEIVRPAKTRFATTFITLRSILEHKVDLQALVTNRFFTNDKISKSEAGKTFSSIVLDRSFWDDCEIVACIGGPLIKLLRMVDSDEKPSLPYVYDGIRRARKKVKEIFKSKEQLYKPYIDIIDRRWDKHFKRNLHVAAYFLNPTFMYGENFCRKPEIFSGLLDVLEKKSICPNGKVAIDEIKLYRERMGSFGREFAALGSKTMRPDYWWETYGYDAPNLQKVAIRILSQTSSSSGCERNWSLFERIHTKKRNKLEHETLSDLVFVNSNLKLKTRYQAKHNLDPVDYECISKTQYWIEEEVDANDQTVDGDIYEDLVPPNIEENTNIFDYDSTFEDNLGDINLDSRSHHFNYGALNNEDLD